MRSHVCYRPVLNKKGFSLIEILVGLGASTIGMLAMAYMIMTQLKATRNISHTMEASYLHAELRETLKSSEICTNSFHSRPANSPSNVNSILHFDTPSNSFKKLYETGADYGNGLLKLQSITLQPHPVDGAVAPDSRGKMKLAFSFLKNGETIGGSNLMRDLTLFVKTDNTGKVTSCSVANEMDAGFTPESFLENIEVKRYACNAPRNGRCDIVTPQDKKYFYCALSRVRSGGNDGGNQDDCYLQKHNGDGSANHNGRWELHARRGDDPSIECSMHCMGFDEAQSNPIAGATTTTTRFGEGRSPADD